MILPADHVLRAVINARLPVPLLLLVCFWSYLFHAVMLPYQVGDVPLTCVAAVDYVSGGSSSAAAPEVSAPAEGSDTLPAKQLRKDHPSLATGTGGKTLAGLRQLMPTG
ncbi:hypothetical protein Tco_1125731 [Tanacetum coccineum]